MSMVACGINEWPRALMDANIQATSGLFQVLTLDSTTDLLAWVGKSPVADTLTTIYFRTGVIPAAGGDTVDVRIETVANGRPTGTLWNSPTNTTNITVAIADSDDNVWKTATLTAGATFAVGDEFAIVIISSAGTPSLVLAGAHASLAGSLGMYPIILQNATGTTAPLANTVLEWIPQFSSAGIKHLEGLCPLDGSMTLTAFNSGSSPNARALRFQVPFKMRCIGARVFMGNIAAGANFTVSLFDASGTTDAAALGQATIDGDFPQATTSDGYVDVMWDEIDADNILTINTTYYIELRPDTTNSVTLFECPTAGTGEPATAIKAFPAESTQLYLATRTWTAGTAGAWSTTTTTLPVISLLFDQLEDGLGGGVADFQLGM